MGEIRTIKRKDDIDEVARRMFKHRKNNSQIILYRTEKPRTQICKETDF